MCAPSANIHIFKKFGASGVVDTNTCSPEHLFAFAPQKRRTPVPRTYVLWISLWISTPRVWMEPRLYTQGVDNPLLIPYFIPNPVYNPVDKYPLMAFQIPPYGFSEAFLPPFRYAKQALTLS